MARCSNYAVLTNVAYNKRGPADPIDVVLAYQVTKQNFKSQSVFIILDQKKKVV